ncbi:MULTISPECIES: GFA family protein [Sphingomonadales]|uniref:Glutathione-dependent formaldehyde-activating enzyme n=1 Tax=Edaphosphingomonas haloaromaticamans TaxID=653954 RepID=A0A1S1HCS4_9SPHN|nr:MULTISPECIES: GFA family protein [Sphingomonadales]OHT20004.1 Glutathione-dependent formaldehyde-activating enzyme [Sphingomonas haloaromaticamans]WRO66137.1 GFA family protein [Tsuneonella sp. CC-YZS046]
MVSRHPGSCHCGGVRFTLDSDPIELTTCDCSLCVKRNALMVKVPEVALHIEQGEQLLSLYVWNSGRAKHYFCRRCGIYVFHRKRAAPDHFGVNIFCLDGFDATALPVRATEGAGMNLVCDDPRPEWPGPRVPAMRSEKPAVSRRC